METKLQSERSLWSRLNHGTSDGGVLRYRIVDTDYRAGGLVFIKAESYRNMIFVPMAVIKDMDDRHADIRVGGLINSDDYENKITLEDMGDFDTTSPDPLDVMNRRGDTRWVIARHVATIRM